MTRMLDTDDETVTRAELLGLGRFNLIVGLLHLAQAAAMFALSNDLSFPITASFLTGDPVMTRGVPTPEVVFDLPIGPAVASFLLLAAVDHLLMATPPVRQWYEANLRQGMNIARWIEYAISASVMMILFGWLQEKDQQPGGDLTAFWFGTVIGLVPWLAIGAYLLAGNDPPGFVYGIFVSLFVLFSSFGVNQWLQYRQVGRWRDYLFGERAYIVLSLVAKSLLAWQIFANVLRS
jgi:Heliorhodopsin